MKKIYFFLLCTIILMTISCTGLKRGVDGGKYVSTSKPNFAISVPTLPLRTAGSFTAQVTTSNNLNGHSVDSWIAVYGGENNEQALAIISQASLKKPYYWNADLTKINSINHKVVTLGDFKFQACTYLITNLQRDAFISLTPSLKQDSQDKPSHIIVRRFATRNDFNEGKITLEYREKAPENFDDIKALPFGAQEFLKTFELRAEQAFVFGVVDDSANIASSYPEGISIRYLNKNFFGDISYNERMY